MVLTCHTVSLRQSFLVTRITLSPTKAPYVVYFWHNIAVFAAVLRFRALPNVIVAALLQNNPQNKHIPKTECANCVKFHWLQIIPDGIGPSMAYSRTECTKDSGGMERSESDWRNVVRSFRPKLLHKTMHTLWYVKMNILVQCKQWVRTISKLIIF